MLGKLIKYDLKAMNRFLIIIHLFLLCASVLIRIFFTGRVFTENMDFNNQNFVLPFLLFLVLFTVLISAAAFATQLVIAIRFYKNTFSDEGYLTHTLPVAGGKLLLSKTIAGCIWGIIDMLFLHISLWIVMATPYVTELFTESWASVWEELQLTDKGPALTFQSFLLLYIATCLIGVITNVVLFYASVAIGQFVPGHKVLGAIAAYFVISTFVSVIMLIIMALSGLLGASIHPLSASFDFTIYIRNSLNLAIICSIIQSAVLYSVTYWIMEKKLNLE